MPTLAEGDGVHVFWEGDGLPLRCPVALYTEEEGEGLTVSGLGVTVTVLLVDGVRPIDWVVTEVPLNGLAVPQLGDAWVDADARDGLPVAVPAMLAVVEPSPEGEPVIVCPLHVAQGVGETIPVAVTPLALAWPEGDAREAEGVTVPTVDAVDEPTLEAVVVPTIDAVIDPSAEGEPVTVAPLNVPPMLGETEPDHVITVGVACPEAEPQDPVGVTVPSPLGVGEARSEGDPVTVAPLHVTEGVSVTAALGLAALGVASPDAVKTLGLPVGVEGSVGVAVVAVVADRGGVLLPVLHPDTLTEAVEL